MAEWTIYHNPQCSKSRQTLALLEKQGIKPSIVEYLKTPPSENQILEILNALTTPASTLVRQKEERYKELPFDLNSKIEIAKKLSQNPALMERPVVVHKGKAVIGRPPENVKVLFS